MAKAEVGNIWKSSWLPPSLPVFAPELQPSPRSCFTSFVVTLSCRWLSWYVSLPFLGVALPCLQLLLKLEEQLFFLGCPPLYQAFTNINAFVEQPIWTHALWNGPWLAEKCPSLSSFSKAWIQSQGEVQKSSVLSDHSMRKGHKGIIAKWHQE